MFDWLKSFTNPSFMPHGHCYLWKPEILWTHVLSDAVIALAYYAIPILLSVFLIKRKQSIPFPEIVGLFVAFIFFCGTTHLVNIYVTWFPSYELQGWVKALTALISIFTAIVLVPKLPLFLSLPGIKQAYEETEQAYAQLKSKNQQMQTVYDAAMDRESSILDLKTEVNELLSELQRPPRYLESR